MMENRMPPEVWTPGVGLSGQSGLKVPRGPYTSSHLNNTWGSLGINNCGGQGVNFLLDTEPSFSVFTEAPGPLSSQSTNSMGLLGWDKCYYFSHPLSCIWNSVLFSHSFWVCNPAGISFTLFGEGYTKQGPGLCIHEYGANSFSLINWTKCKS